MITKVYLGVLACGFSVLLLSGAGFAGEACTCPARSQSGCSAVKTPAGPEAALCKCCQCAPCTCPRKCECCKCDPCTCR